MMAIVQSRWVRILGLIILAALVLLGLWVAWRIHDRDPETSAPDVASTPALVARGEYLAKAADCTACHTIAGGKPFAGGLAFKLPFGTIYSTNITADRETGIGGWSDDDFVRALHTGIAKDGSHLYPAFPYTSYTRLSRDDAVAIKAYLFSLPAVHQPARANDLSFPFNQRWAMGFWNLAFLDQHRFRPEPGLSPTQNRGLYLATALGHCGECHTPRNIGFAMKDGRLLAGEMLQGWHAYNITSDPKYGLGAWSDEQIANYLTKGRAEGHGAAAGPMAEAVANSLQYLKPEDTAALVAYLRTVKAREGKSGTEINPASAAMQASTAWAPGAGETAGLGKRIFEGACASCHQWNGKGQQTPYADLHGSQAVNDPDGSNLIQAVLAGVDLRAVDSAAYMPAFGRAYSDVEIAAVANYAIGHFSGKTGRVTPAMVAKARAQSH